MASHTLRGDLCRCNDRESQGALGPKFSLSVNDVRLDARHVVVRQTEMVADLMHQHMGNNVPQGLVVLCPIVEDGAAIEKDHLGHRRWVEHALPGEIDAVIEAEPVSYTHLRAHETDSYLVCRLLLEKKKKKKKKK